MEESLQSLLPVRTNGEGIQRRSHERGDHLLPSEMVRRTEIPTTRHARLHQPEGWALDAQQGRHITLAPLLNLDIDQFL